MRYIDGKQDARGIKNKQKHILGHIKGVSIYVMCKLVNMDDRTDC